MTTIVRGNQLDLVTSEGKNMPDLFRNQFSHFNNKLNGEKLNSIDPCETLKRREKQLLDSLIKFEALKPAFENAKEIINVYDLQLQEVRELQAQQAAIQDEQHRKELRQEKRKQRLKGIRDGFLGAITTAGIILILL